jgi:hypothetical protein
VTDCRRQVNFARTENKEPHEPRSRPRQVPAQLTRSTEIAAALISAFIASCVLLIQWRYGFNWGDEGWLWYISQRTGLGEVPIRDVFSYDPGRYYWSAAVFKVLGRNGFFEQLIANYLFGAVGLAVSYLAMTRSGMSRGWRIATLLLLGIVIGFPRHKIYEQTLSLISAAGIAFILARPGKARRWFLYGIATGLAAFVGRNSGLYFAVAALLTAAFLKIRREGLATVRVAVALLVGIAVGYSPTFFMMLRFRGFASAFLQSVLLTPNWSWGLRIPFPWHSHAGGLHGLDAWQMRAVSWLCIAVPVTFALIVWQSAGERGGRAQQLALGASLAGVPYLHHAFYHADFFHIAQGVVPFVVAGGAFSQDLWTDGRRRWSLACFCVVSALVLGSWLPMEPLVLHLRTKANAPRAVEQIILDGRDFEVPVDQSQVMRVVQAAFLNCGPHDGGFLEAPYYPGLYAFLGKRSPFWDTYYLWPRSDDLQQRHIQALIGNRTSVVLLNRAASFDGQDRLRISHTYPKLVDFVLTHYQRMDVHLPDGFELYYLPQSCRSQPW